MLCTTLSDSSNLADNEHIHLDDSEDYKPTLLVLATTEMHNQFCADEFTFWRLTEVVFVGKISYSSFFKLSFDEKRKCNVQVDWKWNIQEN